MLCKANTFSCQTALPCCFIAKHTHTHTQKTKQKNSPAYLYNNLYNLQGGELLLNQLTAHILLCKQQTVVY